MKNWTSVLKGWTDASRIAAVLLAQSKIFSVALNSTNGERPQVKKLQV